MSIRTGQPNLCAYSAGNAGVVGLTWAAAKELNTKNITVNAFCPQAASPGHEEEFNKMSGVDGFSSKRQSNANGFVNILIPHDDAWGLQIGSVVMMPGEVSD